jgi:chromosome segregation ATPase
MTPERQALAAAIQRHAALTQHLAAAREARLGIGSDYDAVDQAEEALAAARADEGRTRLGELLGKPTTSPSVAELQAKLDAANAALAATNRDRALVDQEIARLTEQLKFAELARHEAMRAVAIAEPQIARMVEDLHATRQHVLTLEAALTEASKLDLVADRFWHAQRLYRADPALAAQWREAIAALTTDASAPLPGDDNPPPERAEAA